MGALSKALLTGTKKMINQMKLFDKPKKPTDSSGRSTSGRISKRDRITLEGERGLTKEEEKANIKFNRKLSALELKATRFAAKLEDDIKAGKITKKEAQEKLNNYKPVVEFADKYSNVPAKAKGVKERKASIDEFNKVVLPKEGAKVPAQAIREYGKKKNLSPEKIKELLKLNRTGRYSSITSLEKAFGLFPERKDEAAKSLSKRKSFGGPKKGTSSAKFDKKTGKFETSEDGKPISASELKKVEAAKKRATKSKEKLVAFVEKQKKLKLAPGSEARKNAEKEYTRLKKIHQDNVKELKVVKQEFEQYRGEGSSPNTSLFGKIAEGPKLLDSAEALKRSKQIAGEDPVQYIVGKGDDEKIVSKETYLDTKRKRDKAKAKKKVIKNFNTGGLALTHKGSLTSADKYFK
tara:strand:- start:7 stop:1227 length:1221 start_codon:yes stop_codon:yes gene_type:complete